MIDTELTKLFSQYNDKIDNKKVFCGIIKDFFPTDPLKANLILSLYDMKIHEEIKNVSFIGNSFAYRFVKRLMDEHGTSRKNADWAVSIWCVNYGENVLGKRCEIKLVDYESATAPSIQENQKAPLYADLFTYAPCETGNSYKVVGFNGENKNIIIFQNRFSGNNVTEIGDYAFQEIPIKEAIITDGYIKIGSNAFQGCTELSQIVLPISLKEIGDYAFSGCKGLSTIMLPMKLQQVGKYAFASTNIKQINFPASLYWIDEGAFSDCDKITELKIPRTIGRIPDRCFANCDNITKVYIENGIDSIGEEAFKECYSLPSITIPDSVTFIGDNAFAEMDTKFVIECSMGSYAEEYARKHKIKYQLV